MEQGDTSQPGVTTRARSGGFRMLKFNTYDGMGDPSNHIKAYDSQLYSSSFPSSFSGATLKWFHKLPPNSIDCWQDSDDCRVLKAEIEKLI
ncbi:hypothetical protein LIER_04416 [Lithospermum erythrorhizon]|uniref:Retrotransposon gag domain-containing protein n=1 Tax=Lithospermum erythrorhizon TaxID=34254 RepID=A0AAV3NY99_LITER